MNELNIATTSNRHRYDAQLLVIHAETDKTAVRAQQDGRVHYLKRLDFVDQFRAGDVVVANAAATLPASFRGTHRESGRPIELRLAQSLNRTINSFSRWKGVLFGEGDWHLPTEARIDVPQIKQGDRLIFGEALQAEVLGVSATSERLVDIEFLAPPHKLLHLIYQVGRLIQYSYHREDLELWDGQTIFAGAPLALEAPSASFLLTWDTVLALQNKGVQVVPLFHAAGISSTGEERLDALLPLPEYYQIPLVTAKTVNLAKQEKRRVIALGTSVTRALESAATPQKRVRPGEGVTTLLLSPSYGLKIVNGLVTGMHESGTSHLQLLQSFAPWPLIERAYSQAEERGYLWHEYGDSCFDLCGKWVRSRYPRRCWRYSPGRTPKKRLKALLNAASDLYPAAAATPINESSEVIKVREACCMRTKVTY